LIDLSLFSLQTLKLGSLHSLSDLDLCRLDTLSEWLSTDDGGAPIRPGELFNMNSASGATAAGLILTYMIILLQMKMSE
jgi:hypothetical protein